MLRSAVPQLHVNAPEALDRTSSKQEFQGLGLFGILRLFVSYWVRCGRLNSRYVISRDSSHKGLH